LPVNKKYQVTLQPHTVYALDETNKIPEIAALGLSRAKLYVCFAMAIEERYRKLPDHIKRRFTGKFGNGQSPVTHFSKEADAIKDIVETYLAARSDHRHQQDLVTTAMRRLSMTLDPEYRQFMSIFELTLDDLKEQKRRYISEES
jgi:hypothetical protein